MTTTTDAITTEAVAPVILRMEGHQGGLRIRPPARKSKTRRDDLTRGAGGHLRSYRGLIGQEESQARRVQYLLWAIARLHQVLALETDGTLGDAYATPARVVRDMHQVRQSRNHVHHAPQGITGQDLPQDLRATAAQLQADVRHG